MASMLLLRRWINRLVDACTLRVVADDGTPLVIVCDPYGLTTLVADLEDVNDGLEAKVEDITEAAETYRTNLTARYAAYQAAIEQAETMLDYLTTLIDTWNSSS